MMKNVLICQNTFSTDRKSSLVMVLATAGSMASKPTLLKMYSTKDLISLLFS